MAVVLDGVRSAAGAAPDGWEDTPLELLAKRGSGHTPNRQHPEYWNGNIKWISLADSGALDRVFIDETAATITPEGVAHSSAVIHPAGTVLLSRDAGVGKSAIMRTAMAVSQHFIAWTCGPELDNLYLYYWLQYAKPQFERIANGTTIKTIGLQYFKDLRLQKPPLCEQRAIAGALSDVDALLDGLERLIAKKRDVKHAAMQQLLTGRTRLRGFDSGWRSRRVDEGGDVVAGKALVAAAPGLLRPYLRTTNVLDGRINITDVLQMPMTDAEFERFHLKTGDVLLNEGQSLELVGRCCMYRGELGRPCAMQNQLLRFRAYPNTSASFAEQLFRYCQQTGTFSAISTQTTSVAHLGSTRFSCLRLKWPTDLREQEAIAAVLCDMDADFVALEARRTKTRDVKQAMMQELLSGKVRLVVAGAGHA
jgi:type I restriction enzyme, S subunit